MPSVAVKDCHKERHHGKERFATHDQRGRGRQRSNDQVSKSGSSSRLAGNTAPTVTTPPRCKPTYSSSSESVDHIDNWRRKSDEQRAVEREMKRQMQKKVHADPQKSGKKVRGKEKRDDKREETKDGRSQMQRGSKASCRVDVSKSDAGQRSENQKERKKQKRRNNKKRQGIPDNSKSGIDGERPPHADQYESDLKFHFGSGRTWKRR